MTSIDLLRGVAVLLVVLVHMPFSWSNVPTRDQTVALDPALPVLAMAVTDYGRFGVHLFLVISGFCIHLRWARWKDTSRPLDFVAFWRRRLVRLYPPYAAALAASVVGLFLAYGVMLRGSGPGAFGYPSYGQLAFDLTSLVLLLQNLTDASYRIGNQPFWTLALEEQLYLLYFVLLAMRRRLGWGTTLAAVTGVTLLWRGIGLVVGGLPVDPILIGPGRWIEWVLGALAVEAYLGRVALPAWCYSSALAALSLVLAILLNLPGLDTRVPLVTLVNDAAFGVAFFSIVLIVTRADVVGRLGRGGIVRVLAFVGLFSYSLYLTHLPVMVATKQILLRIGIVPGAWEAAVIMSLRFVVAIVAALVFYWIVESRFIRWSRRLGERGGSPARSAMSVRA